MRADASSHEERASGVITDHGEPTGTLHPTKNEYVPGMGEGTADEGDRSGVVRSNEWQRGRGRQGISLDSAAYVKVGRWLRPCRLGQEPIHPPRPNSVGRDVWIVVKGSQLEHLISASTALA
jgi:hypothetical protein